MTQEIKIRRLKIYKSIYVVVAFVLIVINGFILFPYYRLGVFFDSYGTWVQKMGYFLSRHFLILFGAFLFLRVYLMNRQIKELQREIILDAIDEIGEEEQQ
ncbi:hypothetical protein WG954_20895 [Lacibacter sp. H375]|uniref:hypothetical protein n=1 Tax=Lacibacter sp. H375 TaxID=3133424 RepID=UPI0030C5806D